MSTDFAITTLIELAVAVLLVYGFMHEDKVIAFEQNVRRIVVGNYRRFKRKRAEARYSKGGVIPFPSEKRPHAEPGELFIPLNAPNLCIAIAHLTIEPSQEDVQSNLYNCSDIITTKETDFNANKRNRA